MIIAVGSTNLAKKDAVQKAFEKCFPNEEINIIGYSVPSGVSDQPMGDEETRTGAINRCQAVYDEYMNNNENKEPDYAIGLEGGCKWSDPIIPNHDKRCLICFATMAIRDKNNDWGIGTTSSFPLPYRISDLMENEGLELGDADDRIFGMVQSKQSLGSVGILTDGVIDRSLYYQQAIILALVPIIKKDLY